MEITVEVIEAKGLSPKNLNGFSDPYVLMGEEHSHHSDQFSDSSKLVRSKTCYMSLNPKWNPAPLLKLESQTRVKIEIWDKNHDKLDVFEGSVVVDLKYTGKTKSLTWIPLQPRSADDVVSGEVRVNIGWYLKIHPSIKFNAEQRMIRVFLSSTFTDMNEEREVIMKKVMVDLSQFCYERGVSLTYIDMRWGITKEMGDNNQTILACLREVDHSRPYFVGIIGERYGWHQELDGQDKLLTDTFKHAEQYLEYSWIKDFHTRSVTELEIQHGFLLHPSLSQGHSFFFFRDPQYIDSVEQAKRSRFEDKSAYAKLQLSTLKDQIRQRQKNGDCVIHENYLSPQQLGDLLLRDLRSAIESDFPLLSSEASSMIRQRNEHHNYAHQRCEAYVPRQQYFDQLNTSVSHFTEAGRFVLVTGESGSGKSALLSNWWKSLEMRSFVHFIGSSTLASNFSSILVRLFEEINFELERTNAKPLSIPQDEKGLVLSLFSFLAAASSMGGMVIIIDALNQLPPEYHDLRWLPHTLPSRVCIVTSSTSDNEALVSAVDKRSIVSSHNAASIEWYKIQVQPLEEQEKKEIIARQLGLFGKSMVSEFVDQICSHSCGSLPLFLTTVIRELCTIGIHSQLQTQLKQLLSCLDMPSVFQRLITRWEESFDKSLVQQVLLLILCSRSGVTESTIQVVTNAPPIVLSPLLCAMRPTFVIHQGKFNFSHQYLEKAVKTHYPESLHFDTQRKLAQHLKSFPFDEHIAHELPWILLQMTHSKVNDSAQYCEELVDLISNLDNFQVFYKSDDLKYELMQYWRDLKKIDTTLDMGNMYAKQAKQFELTSLLPHSQPHFAISTTLQQLGDFLRESGAVEVTETILNQSLTISTSNGDQAGTAKTLRIFARHLAALDKIEMAKEKYKAALALQLEMFGEDHEDVVDTMGALGILLDSTGKVEEAQERFERCLAIGMKLFGESSVQVAFALQNLGLVSYNKGRFNEARELYEKSLSIYLTVVGELHPGLGELYCNLGLLFGACEKHEEATQMFEKGISVDTKLYGEVHPSVAATLNRMAGSLNKQEKYEEAKKTFEKALEINVQVYGELHGEVAYTLRGLGDTLSDQEQFSDAKEKFEKALSIELQLYGDVHPRVALTYNYLGLMLYNQDMYSEALEAYKKCFSINLELFGEQNDQVATDYSCIAYALWGQSKYAEAEEMARKALHIRLQLDHPSVPSTYRLVAELLERQENPEAEEMFRKADEAEEART